MKLKIKRLFLLFCITPIVALLTIACASENSQFAKLPLVLIDDNNYKPITESKKPDLSPSPTTNKTPPIVNEKHPDPKVTEPEKSFQNLLNKIDSVIKVDFKTGKEKQDVINTVNKFFERLESGTSSSKPIKDFAYSELLKHKVETTLIKNTLDINDNSNFLDISELIKNVDYSLSDFSFLSAQKKAFIKSVYDPNLDFFKQFISARSGLSPSPGPLGESVWKKRVAWPSLQYGIAYKLNNIDKRSAASTEGYDSTLNTVFNFRESILQKDNLIINKIIYVTNQIFATLFKHYRSFLNIKNENQKHLELSKMFVLLQALFYGKNAKEIFKQFLKNNLNYNVDNFLSDLTKKNFGNNEPNFLGKIIVSSNNKKSYENLLMYMNYLNLNRDLAIAKKSYFPSTYARDGAFSGAFSTDDIKDREWYKNKTLFIVLTKNKEHQITDADFNQFFY